MSDKEDKEPLVADVHETTKNAESTLPVGESSFIKPEHNNRTRNAIIVFIASIAIGGGVFGYEMNKSNSVPKPVATADTNPNNTPSTNVNVVAPSNETQKIPAEAQKFVAEVGNRYADPVSTYYAVEAYKKEHAGKSPVLSNEFIDNYDNSGPQDADLSKLGFTAYRLPLNTDVNQAKLMDIFNNYTKPNLDLYMNLLSKNPSAKAVAIIDNEFKSYCSDNTSFKNDDNQIAMLMATAKNKVAEYGSTVNLSVAKATDKRNVTDATLFPMTDVTMFGSIPWGKQVIKNYTIGGIDLVVDADTYNGKTVSHTSKVTHGVTLAVWARPVTGEDNFSYISIGQNN